jgi:hypothetical protein
MEEAPMADPAPRTAIVHELGSDPILQVSDRLDQVARLTRGWLNALEAGSNDDALISRASLVQVIDNLVESLRSEAESLPDHNLPTALSAILLARCAELEYTRLTLKQLTIDRGDLEWRALLLAWVRAADRSLSVLSATAKDISKRLRGPRIRRARADENNSTLTNAITLYREDPRTGKQRSARTIAQWLRRNSGFDPFTERRSDEALTRLVQRILRKL